MDITSTQCLKLSCSVLGTHNNFTSDGLLQSDAETTRLPCRQLVSRTPARRALFPSSMRSFPFPNCDGRTSIVQEHALLVAEHIFPDVVESQQWLPNLRLHMHGWKRCYRL